MIRVAGYTIALATKCTFEVTLNTISARTKRDRGNDEVPEYISFSLSSENLVGMNDHTMQHTQATLMDAFVRKQAVSVEVMLAANSSLSVPAGDWVPGPVTHKGFKAYGGMALIKQLSLNGATDGFATMSVQLTGIGELTPVESAAIVTSISGDTLYIEGPVEIDKEGLQGDGTISINDNTLDFVYE